MKILVVGAGQVGSTIVEVLHHDHEVAVIDTDADCLRALAYAKDVRTFPGNGASRQGLLDAGLADADLFIACTSRDEVNLVACSFARAENPKATTVIRTSNAEYVELWRAGQLDVNFAVSSELETGNAVVQAVGVPAARQTALFAEEQVQIAEFAVTADADPAIIGRPLRDMRTPADARVAAVIRNDAVIFPRGDDALEVGDLVVVIGSPGAARQWSTLLSPESRQVRDVVVYGGGQVGTAIARALGREGIGVRLIEPDRDRARRIAEELPGCRVYNTDGVDPDFVERERIGDVQAAVFAMREDAKNLFAATLASIQGISFTIAIVHDLVAQQVYYRAGIDVAINPRNVTADAIVRFAHDPRTQQVAMFENDRFEVLDITTRPESEYVGLRFRDMPIRGALIGAIVRDGKAVFPRSDDILQGGDRVIVFTETTHVTAVEKVL